MTDFLNSVKADLLDRRLLPLVVVVAVALAAAIGYAVLGGGSTAPAPSAAVPTGPTISATHLTISRTSPEDAVAETTGDVPGQHVGVARNPFTPLPEVKPKTSSASAAAATTSSSSGSSGATSGSGSSSSGSGGSGSEAPAKPSTPAKPKTVYHVAILFGVVPAGAAPLSAQLTPYENLKLLTPLPSSQQPLVVFRGVTAGGKSATFTLVGEAILHGAGACLPSASQCEAIDLQPGQSEQLEYLPPGGQTVTYEMRIVSIAAATATSAGVKSVLGGESKAGRALLSRAGLLSLPYLRYSNQPGVLVFSARHASAARAHASRHSRHGR